MTRWLQEDDLAPRTYAYLAHASERQLADEDDFKVFESFGGHDGPFHHDLRA